jgi:hypothetical protein
MILSGVPCAIVQHAKLNERIIANITNNLSLMTLKASLTS